MNPLIPRTTILPLLIGWALACFGLLPQTQAVSPAPDGGYPGGNTAEGQNALFSLTTGGYNTANGWNSLHTVSSGRFNTAFGAATLFANTGDHGTAVGAGALLSNTTGLSNTATGAFALLINTTGGGNTANGYQALSANVSGLENTAIGYEALFYATGSQNIALGVAAGTGVTTATNVIAIGTAGNNVDNSCYIGNIFNATSSGGSAVFINSNGRLRTMTSSRRFKQEIKPMEGASEALFALQPVTFRYKKGIDPAGKSQFGLVAEEVEKVIPDLVVRDEEGKHYSVRYDQVNAMLLNEFLKEHKKVEEQQVTIADLRSTVKQQQKGFEFKLAKQQKQIEALTAGFEKASAQLELSKPAPQTALNDQ